VEEHEGEGVYASCEWEWASGASWGVEAGYWVLVGFVEFEASSAAASKFSPSATAAGVSATREGETVGS
jgi:hypothetical protein